MSPNREPFYGVYLDDEGTAKSLLTGAAVAQQKVMQEPFYGVFIDENGERHSIEELGGGGVTKGEVEDMIDAALEHKDAIIAAVASASTILFSFSEDGGSFNFLGGSFGWFATHEHFGVVTISAQLEIPFVTGRLIMLDITNENNPTLTTKSINPSMTFEDNEFVIGNMYRDGQSNVVYIYGGGFYKHGADSTDGFATEEYVDEKIQEVVDTAINEAIPETADFASLTKDQTIEGSNTFTKPVILPLSYAGSSAAAATRQYVNDSITNLGIKDSEPAGFNVASELDVEVKRKQTGGGTNEAPWFMVTVKVTNTSAGEYNYETGLHEYGLITPGDEVYMCFPSWKFDVDAQDTVLEGCFIMEGDSGRIFIKANTKVVITFCYQVGQY